MWSAMGTHYTDTARFLLQDEVCGASAHTALLLCLAEANGVHKPVTAEGAVNAKLLMGRTGAQVEILLRGQRRGLPQRNDLKVLLDHTYTLFVCDVPTH